VKDYSTLNTVYSVFLSGLLRIYLSKIYFEEFSEGGEVNNWQRCYLNPLYLTSELRLNQQMDPELVPKTELNQQMDPELVYKT
jgi:hypothetical protein